MPDLRFRSYKKEFLDRDDIPFEDIRQNMKELNRVNTLLGGHKITIAGVRELSGDQKKLPLLTICEIGCGGGDNLNAVATWCNKQSVKADFVGVDIKAACTTFAAKQHPTLSARWITKDYALADFSSGKPSIIFSSLFCHHFKEDELVNMLHWMKRNSGQGFFINDLHRHPLAYFLIKWLTRFFSRSYLVKNDAPLSVARGFKRNEWEQIFRLAGISSYTIKWKWAFRYLIVCKHES